MVTRARTRRARRGSSRVEIEPGRGRRSTPRATRREPISEEDFQRARPEQTTQEKRQQAEELTKSQAIAKPTRRPTFDPDAPRGLLPVLIDKVGKSATFKTVKKAVEKALPDLPDRDRVDLEKALSEPGGSQDEVARLILEKARREEPIGRAQARAQQKLTDRLEELVEIERKKEIARKFRETEEARSRNVNLLDVAAEEARQRAKERLEREQPSGPLTTSEAAKQRAEAERAEREKEREAEKKREAAAKARLQKRLRAEEEAKKRKEAREKAEQARKDAAAKARIQKTPTPTPPKKTLAQARKEQDAKLDKRLAELREEISEKKTEEAKKRITITPTPTPPRDTDTGRFVSTKDSDAPTPVRAPGPKREPTPEVSKAEDKAVPDTEFAERQRREQAKIAEITTIPGAPGTDIRPRDEKGRFLPTKPDAKQDDRPKAAAAPTPKAEVTDAGFSKEKGKAILAADRELARRLEVLTGEVPEFGVPTPPPAKKDESPLDVSAGVEPERTSVTPTAERLEPPQFESFKTEGERTSFQRVKDFAESVGDFSLGLVPVVGTGRDVKNLIQDFDNLSAADRAKGIGFATLSAIGDVAILAGPVLKLTGVASKGGKVTSGFAVDQADEALGLIRTSARAGQKPNLVLEGSTRSRDVDEARRLVQSLADDADTLKRVPEVRITSSASESGIEGLKEIAGGLKAIPGYADNIQKKVSLEIVVERNLTAEEAARIARQMRLAGARGANNVTVKVITRPSGVTNERELRDLAKFLAKERKTPEAEDEILSGLQASLSSTPEDLDKAGSILTGALRTQGIKARKDTIEIEPLGTKKVKDSDITREVTLEPEKGVTAGSGGGVAVLDPPKAPTGGGPSVGTVRTQKGGKLLIAASPSVTGSITGKPAFDPFEPIEISTEFPEISRVPQQADPTPATTTTTTEGEPETGDLPGEQPERTTPPSEDPDETTTTDPDTDTPTVTQPQTPAGPFGGTFTPPAGAPTSTPSKTPQQRPQIQPRPEPQPRPQSQPVKAKAATAAPPVSRVKTRQRVRGEPVERFQLPSNLKLPPGQFPETVFWQQGIVGIRLNLFTGDTQLSHVPVSRANRAPKDTFRVVKIGDKRPPARVLPLGIADVIVTESGLRFVERDRPGINRVSEVRRRDPFPIRRGV